MVEGGYIRIWRKIRDHWIWQEPQYLKWWLDLLMLVNYQPGKVLINGKLTMIDIGEHHTSISKLAERWFVDRKTADKFLNLLEKDSMISIKKSRQNGTTIKVLNYQAYQAFFEADMDNETDNGGTTPRTTKPHQQSQRSGHKEEVNTLNKKEEPKEYTTITTTAADATKSVVVAEQTIIKYYRDNIQGTPSKSALDKLCAWLDIFSAEVIIKAMDESIKANKRKLSYIEGVLRNWKDDRLLTLSLVEGHLLAWENKKNKSPKPSQRPNRFANFKERERDYSEIERREMDYLLKSYGIEGDNSGED